MHIYDQIGERMIMQIQFWQFGVSVIEDSFDTYCSFVAILAPDSDVLVLFSSGTLLIYSRIL